MNMKKLKWKTLALALLVCVQAYSQTTLDQCVRMAYENYPQIKEKGLIDACQGYDLKNASLAWVPRLNISAKATWQSDVVEMPFDMPGFEFDIPHDQYGVTADLTQQIWDGGATAAKGRQIKAGAEVKRRQLDVNMYSIRSKVQSIYLGIILLDKQIELNNVLVSNLSRNQKEVQTLVDGGMAGPSDLDQIRVNILTCEQQQAALETDRKAYLRMLGLLTGQDMTGLTLVEPEPESNPAMEIKRPELALYDAQAVQLQAQKDQLNTSLWPRLNLNLQAGYGRPGLNMLSGSFDPYFVAGVKLQWDFGALYTLRNDRRKSDSDLRRLELTRESFMLNTSMEAVQKRSRVEKDEDVLRRDEEIISLRGSIRETGERQYKEGVIAVNDYLSLLDEEFKARLSYNVHKMTYIMDLLDLRQTLGVQ